MAHSGFGTLKLLHKLPHFTSWKSTLPSVIVLDTKSSSCKKNKKTSQCNIFTVSDGYFARFTCTWAALYHSLMLLLLWWKVVKRSNWPLTSLDCGLQKSLNLSQIVSRFISPLDNPQDTYWSIPNLPDQGITFLLFWHSGRAASSHSKIFLHLSFHLRNLWYSASLTIQSILDPLCKAYTCWCRLVGAY